MTKVLLLEAHQDDAVLFASWTILRYGKEIDIATVLGVAKCQPAVESVARRLENERALVTLTDETRDSRSWWWPYEDTAPDWDMIEADIAFLAEPDTGRSRLAHGWNQPYERVFAPYPEPDGRGHEQHDMVGNLALKHFGSERTTFYTTYKFGGPRTEIGRPVPYEREWVPRKLRALACYESQIMHGPVRFFTMGLDEYLVEP